MTIHILAPDVAAKIAAGEVVERPANVAKELLENSLDAGATEIRVEIREGGQRLLRVIDNGHGMTAEEAPLALLRHATSKIHDADDLYQIQTFGFRGEALYSIAAVSQMTITTRHQDEPFGTQLRVEAGNIVSQQRAGTPVGTIINIEHLFYNVPARKKFLRKAPTEAGQITAVVQRYALAYPDRRFSLVNEGKLIFQSTGSGDLYDVLVKLYGLENAKQMTPVGLPRAARGNAADAPTPLLDEIDFMPTVGTEPQAVSHPSKAPIHVFGYTSLPTLTRANRSNIDIFVNRRYVEDRSVTHAIVQAYHTLLPGGRFPMAVIFVEIDPSEVDVNVHPQKVQVRFVDERAIFGATQKAVRRALVQTAPVPDLTLPTPTPAATPLHEEVSTNAAWEWTEPADLSAPPWANENVPVRPVEQSAFDLYTPPPRRDAPPLTPPPFTSPPVSPAHPAPPAATPAPTNGPAAWSERSAPASQPSAGQAPRDVEVTTQKRQMPPLRVVGQIGAMYIVAEGPEGMYLIDQHAAHERILYEKYLAQRYGTVEGEVPRQHLLEPLTLHVGHELTGLMADYLTQLTQVGFEIEAFGGDTFLVRTIPSVLAGQDPLRTLEEIVSAMGHRRNLVGEALEARMVKMICKRAAIKAGQLLSDLEMQELIHQLEACQSPRTCPHGRPTMIQLSAGELEKAFGRV
ncbi:MAG: DNA mismatch repair endonuclease MutL [Caldilineaceae bacterium]|nr:DNA mismatch repair endonuclease MutL [Caldilineaceae bacterium]